MTMIGLLFVHGIGEQRRGETTAKLICEFEIGARTRGSCARANVRSRRNARAGALS